MAGSAVPAITVDSNQKHASHHMAKGKAHSLKLCSAGRWPSPAALAHDASSICPSTGRSALLAAVSNAHLQQ